MDILSRFNRYIKPALLVLDEIGYLTYNDRSADLLFQVVNGRYQRSSTILTTNLAFSDWGGIFPNATCVVTLVDRLCHHAEIIAIEGESYRLKESRERWRRCGRRGRSRRRSRSSWRPWWRGIRRRAWDRWSRSCGGWSRSRARAKGRRRRWTTMRRGSSRGATRCWSGSGGLSCPSTTGVSCISATSRGRTSIVPSRATVSASAHPGLERPRPRRRPGLPAAALAAALALAPGAAAASSVCGLDRENRNLASPLLGAFDEPVATDTRPWFYGRCERPDEPLACTLVTSGESVEVRVDGLDRACAADGAHLLRLVPARHLTPSRTYTLECASTPLDLINFNPERGLTTRDDDTPSLPPPPLADLVAVRRHQDDSGCCSDPIYTDLLVPEDPVFRDFLDDGGILEVRLARGEPWVQLQLDEPPFRLPAVDGDIVVTAVGADGVRGQPFTIADNAIREELVYLDCRCHGTGYEIRVGTPKLIGVVP